MRCPKCGYISFDHLEVCLKCKKNIEASSSSLNGFVLNVRAPSFLDLQLQQDDKSPEEIELGEDAIFLDEEFVDEDLDILVEGEDSDEMAEVSLEDDELGDFELPEGAVSFDSNAMGDNEESGEIEIDLSQFDNAVESEATPVGGKNLAGDNDEELSINIDFPEELSDISDLAPPAAKEQKPDMSAAASGDSGDEDFPDLELGDLDFDLGLDDLEAELPGGVAGGKDAVLTLDDIEFPETLAPGGAKKTKSEAGKDIDDDLNIELDLGGLSIHKDV